MIEFKTAPDGYEYPVAYTDPDPTGNCPECGHFTELHARECIALGRDPETAPAGLPPKRDHKCACTYGNRTTSEQRKEALKDVAFGMAILLTFHKQSYRREIGREESGDGYSVKDAQKAAYSVLEALDVLAKDHEKEE